MIADRDTVASSFVCPTMSYHCKSATTRYDRNCPAIFSPFPCSLAVLRILFSVNAGESRELSTFRLSQGMSYRCVIRTSGVSLIPAWALTYSYSTASQKEYR